MHLNNILLKSVVLVVHLYKRMFAVMTADAVVVGMTRRSVCVLQMKVFNKVGS
jgi:hypothetical protein